MLSEDKSEEVAKVAAKIISERVAEGGTNPDSGSSYKTFFRWVLFPFFYAFATCLRSPADEIKARLDADPKSRPKVQNSISQAQDIVEEPSDIDIPSPF